MTKKTVATASDLIGAIERIEASVRRIEVAVAKLASLIEPAPLWRINPDRRYRIAELEPFGLKPGLLYKRHKHLIRKDGHLSYMPAFSERLRNQRSWFGRRHADRADADGDAAAVSANMAGHFSSPK